MVPKSKSQRTKAGQEEARGAVSIRNLDSRSIRSHYFKARFKFRQTGTGVQSLIRSLAGVWTLCPLPTILQKPGKAVTLRYPRLAGLLWGIWHLHTSRFPRMKREVVWRKIPQVRIEVRVLPEGESKCLQQNYRSFLTNQLAEQEVFSHWCGRAKTPAVITFIAVKEDEKWLVSNDKFGLPYAEWLLRLTKPKRCTYRVCP